MRQRGRWAEAPRIPDRVGRVHHRLARVARSGSPGRDPAGLAGGLGHHPALPVCDRVPALPHVPFEHPAADLHLVRGLPRQGVRGGPGAGQGQGVAVAVEVPPADTYEDVATLVLVTPFIALVTALAEGVAIQSVSLALHGRPPTWRALGGKLAREVLVGLLLGAASGLLVGGLAFAWKESWRADRPGRGRHAHPAAVLQPRPLAAGLKSVRPTGGWGVHCLGTRSLVFTRQMVPRVGPGSRPTPRYSVRRRPHPRGRGEHGVHRGCHRP
jgi:hypothetical protein